MDEILKATEALADQPAERWKAFIDHPGFGRLDFDSCQKAWETIFQNWNSEAGPRPCWIPDSDRIQESNLAAMMRDVGCGEVQHFHRWTVENRDEFWDLALEYLPIAFREEPETIFGSEWDPRKPELLAGARLNIVESCFQTSDDQIAVVSGDANGSLAYHTYGELRIAANRVSNLLVEQGFAAGDRIGIIMPVTFTSIAVYLGIIQAGIIAVSIADSFAGPEISSRLDIAGARAVIAFRTLNRSGKSFSLGERIEQATELPIFFVDEEDSDWKEKISRQAETFEARSCGPLEPINILFSSGTTGDPKAIPWNHTTPIKCAVDGLLFHDLQAGDVVAWPTNLGWMMGPWLIFATLINRGTIAVYDDAPFGEGFGKFVQDARVNMLGLVPSMVRLWRAQNSMEQFDWSQIKCFSSTGEASNAGDMFYLSWLAGMRPIIEYCGGTEIGGGYISSTMIQSNSPATFSTPAFGVDIKILDEEGNEADEGELFLVPPSIGLSIELMNRDHFETYFEGCPADEQGNPLRRHGDHFKKLNGGYFAAGGRTDDTMNLGGIKVSSVEIEKILNQLEEVSETAAIAVPFDESGPDQLVVFFVLTETTDRAELDTDSLMKKMNDAIRSKLNPLFKIRRIEARDSLPRTASNKVMRRLLRDEFHRKS